MRILEASLAHNTSHDALRGHLYTAIRKAHGIEEGSYSYNGPSYPEVFPGHVVYSHGGKTLKRTYTAEHGDAGTAPKISLGEPKAVHSAYVDSKESAEVVSYLVEDLELSRESVKFTQGEPEIVSEGVVVTLTREASGRISPLPKPIPIKIIGPGWGSMAYYSEKMIKETGPQVFIRGTHMMWNHMGAFEESDRPEGDLSNLAAVLTKDAVWKDEGPKGPGLYSEAKVFSDYAQQVADKGPHIGVSINAAIKAHEGEAEGRKGRIADAFVKAFSTDFVTKAGAGGAPIVPVIESDRAPIKEKETKAMLTEAEITALQTENTALKESLKTVTARVTAMETQQNQLVAIATVGAVLREAEIEFNPKLLKRACSAPVMKEGKLDDDWVKTIVSDFSDGYEGRVSGMGHAKEARTEKEITASKEAEKAVWTGLGLSDKAAEVAMGVK